MEKETHIHVFFTVTDNCEKKKKHTLYIKKTNKQIIYTQSVFFNGFIKIIIELSQLLGRAEMGDPWEKPPVHPRAELGLSNMWPDLGSNPQRWDDEPFTAPQH